MNQLEMMLDGIEAILFDIDGTLIDSMNIWGEVDRIYLARYGKEMPPDFSQKLSGLSIRETADYFRYVIGIDEPQEKMLADWNELAYEQYRYHIPVKKGVMRFLEEVKKRNLKTAVGTSNTTRLAMTALEVLGLKPYMMVILTGEDVLKGKPDPYIYLEGARRLQVDPSKCLVFEDIVEGVKAGKNAGMKVCACQDDFSDYQKDQKRALADYYIDSFEDIFENKAEVLK